MFKDFKEFAMRGNVVDMAIGIVIGAAFGTIVKSFVDDVLMPPIGLLLGNVDFSNLFVTLKEGSKAAGPYVSLASAKAAGAVTLNLGIFINTIISFVIIAFAVFLVIKGINRMKREKEAPRPSPTPRNAPSVSPPSPSRPVAAPTAPRSYRRHKDGNGREPGLAAKQPRGLALCRPRVVCGKSIVTIRKERDYIFNMAPCFTESWVPTILFKVK